MACEGLVVERDVADAADDHAGALDRRLRLQAADVVELADDRIRLGERNSAHVTRLKCEEKERYRTQQHEKSDPDVNSFAMHKIS
jgi:hypothetical protein